MFRLYSKGCEYALRALICVAPEEEKRRFQAAEVCRKVGIPEPYTRKVFQALTKGGFLRAVRGPGGGYELQREPADISLLEVICAVDGEETFDQCILGLPECGTRAPCPLHGVWEKEKKQLLKLLAAHTLQDLVQIKQSNKNGASQKTRSVQKRKARPTARR